MAVDTLICGAISSPFARMLASSGITIIPEIAGQTEEVLNAFLKGNLFDSKFLMPGCKKIKFICNQEKPAGQSNHQRPDSKYKS
jgi:predicted Fe-Mo cluster-binding NifX family protein